MPATFTFWEEMMRALYLLLFVSGAAFADDSAIMKCRALTDAASRLGCYDAIPLAAAATAPQEFGMEPVRKQQGPASVESTIVGDFDGWASGAQIRLANGQVWRVIDGSDAVLPRVTNPKVKITSNLFGTLFMQIEGTNNSPKVRRVR